MNILLNLARKNHPDRQPIEWRDTMGILLIYPPYGTPVYPYISIPVLAGYLRSRNIGVSALDANSAYFRELIREDRIREAQAIARARLSELNEKSMLSFSEIVELARLIRILSDSTGLTDRMYWIGDPDTKWKPDERMRTVDAAINLVSYLDFPEIVDTQGAFARYFSTYSEYATRDLLVGMEEKGRDTQILEHILIPALEKHAPGIVGFSVCFPSQVLPAFKCARIVKRMRPRVHVCMGGSFISCHMRNLKETRLFDVIDSFVLDDGEISLERLAGELAKTEPDLGRVPGLIYRLKGKICKNDPAPVLDLESLPPPAYDILALDDYLIPRKGMLLSYRLSRGCSWGRCAFCRSEMSMVCHHQQPSADHIFEQLRSFVAETGVRGFHFTDDAASPDVLEALSRRIVSEKLGVVWVTHARFDPRLTLERCRLMRQAGCWHLALGLESYNDRILRLMGKGTTTKLIDRVLSNIAWAGIPATVYMILGLPTETEQEALASCAKVRELVADGLIARCHYSLFRIESYSPIASHPERYGIYRIHPPPGQDLDPPVASFASSGMDRERAIRLGIFESAALETIIPKDIGLRHTGKLRLNGKTVALNHEANRMEAIIRQFWHQAGWDGHLTFGRWLEQGDLTVPPLKASLRAAPRAVSPHPTAYPAKEAY
jgi:anaerobic magnesium-protoporphyrin IX monomethyl ester cyclase